jgi:hypothetical protein
MTGYENTLAATGVDRFLFFISAEQEHYREVIKRAIDLDPYEMDDSGNYWYKKTIQKEVV